ncbi:unnamed protein product, partial [Heterosigma akashiwo]
GGLHALGQGGRGRVGQRVRGRQAGGAAAGRPQAVRGQGDRDEPLLQREAHHPRAERAGRGLAAPLRDRPARLLPPRAVPLLLHGLRGRRGPVHPHEEGQAHAQRGRALRRGGAARPGAPAPEPGRLPRPEAGERPPGRGRARAAGRHGPGQDPARGGRADADVLRHRELHRPRDHPPPPVRVQRGPVAVRLLRLRAVLRAVALLAPAAPAAEPA